MNQIGRNDAGVEVEESIKNAMRILTINSIFFIVRGF